MVPKLLVCRRPSCPSAVLVSVPEATVNKDDFAVPGKHQIRFSRKAVVVQPEAIAETMGDFSDAIFRLCVLVPDSPHYLTAFLAVVYVCHVVKSNLGSIRTVTILDLRFQGARLK